MVFSHDEKMLIMIYGYDNKAALEKRLRKMKAQLTEEEIVLYEMTENLLAKLSYLNEETFQRLCANLDF